MFKVHTKFWIPHAEKLLNQIKHGCLSRVCILSKEFTYSLWNLEASSSLAWVNVTQSIEYCIIQTIGSVYGALCMAWILYYPNYWQCVWCYFVWLPQFLMYGFHSQLKYSRCTHGASTHCQCIDKYTLSELECICEPRTVCYSKRTSFGRQANCVWGSRTMSAPPRCGIR